MCTCNGRWFRVTIHLHVRNELLSTGLGRETEREREREREREVLEMNCSLPGTGTISRVR